MIKISDRSIIQYIGYTFLPYFALKAERVLCISVVSCIVNILHPMENWVQNEGFRI